MQPQSTSDYIASHGVREALEAAVKLVLDEKPADPLAVIAATLVAQRQLGTSRLSSRSGAESAHAQTSAEVTSVCSNQHEAAKTVTTRRALLRSKFLRRHASAEDLFAAWDMDHNGRLSIEELTEGLVDNGYSEMEASQILTLLDVDHDGTVSEAEFREGFYRSLPAQTRMARLPSTVDFASLDGGTYPSLPVEEAGITLHQLRILWAHIELSCVRDGWMSVRGARITQPELVNLYDAVRYVIKPATNARQCSLVELMATRAQPPKWFVSHWWGHPVLRTLHCLEQHAADHGYDDNTPYWICACAVNQHTFEGVSMASAVIEAVGGVQVTTGAANGVSAAMTTSSAVDNPPVSAGGPTISVPLQPSPTIGVLRTVSASRALEWSAFFIRLIEKVAGRVVSVLDEEGTTFHRAWCCLEMYFARTYEVYTSCEGAAYDLSSYADLSQAVYEEGLRGSQWLAETLRRLPSRRGLRAVGLTDGPTDADTPDGLNQREHVKAASQVFRQSHFPVGLVRNVIGTKLRDADSSVAADKKLILNYIAGRRGAALDAPPLTSSAAYEQFDSWLVANFVAGSWR